MQAVEAFRERKGGNRKVSWAALGLETFGARGRCAPITHQGRITDCGSSIGPGNKEVVTWDFTSFSLAM